MSNILLIDLQSNKNVAKNGQNLNEVSFLENSLATLADCLHSVHCGDEEKPPLRSSILTRNISFFLNTDSNIIILV